MKYRRTILVGIIICILGAVCLDMIVYNTIGNKPAGLKAVPGFSLILLGAYIIFRGKIQQKEERKKR